jgi:hypothetical protein
VRGVRAGQPLGNRISKRCGAQKIILRPLFRRQYEAGGIHAEGLVAA